MSLTTIETHPTGTFFDFSDPRPEMIHVEDIALGLSQRCRFGAFTRRFYSVAEHALLVHRLVRGVAGPELEFAALHHDSHEAYLGDVPTPLKPTFGAAYKKLAKEIDAVLGEKFGIDPSLMSHDLIKAADRQALAIEAGVLKRSRGVGPHWQAWGYMQLEPVEGPTGAVACHEPQWCEALFLSAHRDAYAAMQNERQAA